MRPLVHAVPVLALATELLAGATRVLLAPDERALPRGPGAPTTTRTVASTTPPATDAPPRS